MKKAVMLQKIKEIRSIFSDAAEVAKIDLDSLVWFKEDIHEKYTVPYIEEAYKWIMKIFDEKYAPFKRYYRQRGPEYWQRLVQFGDAELYPEWRELQKLLKSWKAAFFTKDKPVFFRKAETKKLLNLKNHEL